MSECLESTNSNNQQKNNVNTPRIARRSYVQPLHGNYLDNCALALKDNYW